ncbi:hypothetical protein [Marinobacter lutaoensis]|uniref:hypothetical protein n=1 Tax=Marinobacter lutaoensis TaxID=135739 RepID=UPI001115588B|nr:hypothetical protein [Marinobacter lutaoensis]
MKYGNLVIACLAVVGIASVLSPATKAEDQTTATRTKPWEVVDLSQGSVGGTGLLKEQSVGTIDGGSLQSTWEGIKGSPQYQNIKALVENNEQILMTMESRISALENQPPRNTEVWVEEPPTITGGGTSSNMERTIWEPPFTDQTSDFTQTALITESRSNPVEIYEYNTLTGERRLKDSYTEEKVVEYTVVRDVSVQVQEEEVTEQKEVTTYLGTYTTDVPVKENCTYDPPRSTVDEDKFYVAQETCDYLTKVTVIAKAEDKDYTEECTSPLGICINPWVEIGRKESTVWQKKTASAYVQGTRSLEPECRLSYGKDTAIWAIEFQPYQPDIIMGINPARWHSVIKWQAHYDTYYPDTANYDYTVRSQDYFGKKYDIVGGYQYFTTSPGPVPTKENPHIAADGTRYWAKGDPVIWERVECNGPPNGTQYCGAATTVYYEVCRQK